MVPYDYGQLPPHTSVYPPPPANPSIDPAGHYSMIPSFAMPPSQAPSHYASMMAYPTKTDSNFVAHAPSPMPPMGTYPMAPTANPATMTGGQFFALFPSESWSTEFSLLISDSNYYHPAVPMPMMISAQMPYAPVSQPLAPPPTVEEKTDTQLIIFD